MPRFLAIVLGATKWPAYPAFEATPAFETSARFFRNYLLGKDGLGISSEDDVLWLFDDDSQPGDIITKVRTFLKSRSDDAVTDVLFYYVGHGAYVQDKYCLALRCTSPDTRELTTLPAGAIARALFDETPDKRHIVVIDACYAAGAVRDFVYQSAGDSLRVLREQVREGLPEVDLSRGTALFCAAGPKAAAKAPWEDQFTMFSGALFNVLVNGDPAYPEFLSLEELASLVETKVIKSFRSDSVRPELHTPRQELGDIRTLRLFPNAAQRPWWRALEAAVQDLREQMGTQTVALQGMRATLEKMLIDTPVEETEATVPEFRDRVRHLLYNPSVPDAAITHFLDTVLRAGVFAEQAMWTIDIEEYKQELSAYRVKASTEYHYANMFSDQSVHVEIVYGVRPDDFPTLSEEQEVGRYVRIAVGEEDYLRGRGPLVFSKKGLNQKLQVTLSPLGKNVFRTEYRILMAVGEEQGIRPARFVKVFTAVIQNFSNTTIKARVETGDVARNLERAKGRGNFSDPSDPTDVVVLTYGGDYKAPAVQGISPGERAFCFTLLAP